MDLKRLTEHMSGVVSALFAEKGSLPPLYMMELPSGEVALFDPRDLLGSDMLMLLLSSHGRGKRIFAHAVQAVIEAEEAVSYVQAVESWVVKCNSDEEKAELRKWRDEHDGSIGEHPRRFEQYQYIARSKDGGFCVATQDIIRPAGQPPSLLPVEFAETPDEVRGRMSNYFGPLTGEVRKWVDELKQILNAWKADAER